MVAGDDDGEADEGAEQPRDILDLLLGKR